MENKIREGQLQKTGNMSETGFFDVTGVIEELRMSETPIPDSGLEESGLEGFFDDTGFLDDEEIQAASIAMQEKQESETEKASSAADGAEALKPLQTVEFLDDEDFLDDPDHQDESGYLDDALTAEIEAGIIQAAVEAINKKTNAPEETVKSDHDQDPPEETQASQPEDYKAGDVMEPADEGAPVPPEPAEEDAEHGRSGGKILNFVIGGLGVAIALVLFVIGYRYNGIREVKAKEAEFASVGAQLNSQERIGGEDTTRLIAAARIAREEEEKRLAEEQRAREELEEKKEALLAQAGTVPVDMALSSLQSDLKIKIRDTSSMTLIAGVPFHVMVTLPDGTTAEYEDDDRDGIIYRSSVKAGKYTVKILPLVDMARLSTDDVTEDEQYQLYSRYKIPENAQTVEVRDQIEYKKIDVADEIKNESQIDVAAEDTAHNDTIVESVIEDTVEWTESTQVEVEVPQASDDPTADQYEEVQKSEIPDPYIFAYSGLRSRSFRLLEEVTPEAAPAEETVQTDTAATESEGDAEAETAATEEASAPADTTADTDSNAGQEQAPEPVVEEAKSTSVVLDKTSISAVKGDPDITLKATVTWSDGTVNEDAEWTSSDMRIATVSSGVVHIVGTGSCSITAARGVHSESCVLTVTDPGQTQPAEGENAQEQTTAQETEKKTIVVNVSPISITLAPGKTQRLGVLVENAVNPSVTFSSSHMDIADVAADGTITAKAEGDAIITVTSAEDSSCKAEVTVKVITAVDEDAMLKDANGNQLYVWDGGVYREAFVRDYKNFDTFYRKKGGVKSYAYTGWQTIGGLTYYYDKNGNPVTGTQTIQGVTYNFGTDGVLQTNTQLGIDVSGWNGTINWQKVKAAGVSYAVIRCGYRGSATGVLVRDSMFSANMSGASAAGIKTGVYFYSQAITEAEAVEEASMVVDLVKGYSLSLPVFLDVEYSGGRGDTISATQRTKVIKAFCQTIASSGYAAGVYANTNWFNEKINTAEIANYHIWLAQYAAAPTYTKTRYDLWQYTDRGRISGISGNVDMNQVYRSY